MIEERRSEEETPFVAWNRQPAPVDDQRCAFRHAEIHVTGDFVAVRVRDQGPMSTLSAVPGPTFSFLALSVRVVTSGSATSQTATTAEIAIQRSPADPYAAPIIASAANSKSASGNTTA